MHDPCRFEYTHKETFNEMRQDVKEIRAKIFNGLTELPGEVKALRQLMFSILVALLLGIGGVAIWMTLTSVNVASMVGEARDLVEDIRSIYGGENGTCP